MNRIEVLDKVKKLFLLPELECMTITQVADYFEVPGRTISSQYNYNKDEFDSDGVHLKQLNDFKSLSDLNSITLKTTQRRGFLEITLPNNTIVTIPNCGVKCFPKRAILRMGMLLRDSVIAKEVRTQLLNTFEHATEEQRTADIDEEKRLLGDVVENLANDDSSNAFVSFTEYVKYKNRYIKEIEQHNAELAQKNADLSKQNEEITSDNKALAKENEIYAKDVLKWTDRASANRAVRVLAAMCFKNDFAKAWNTVYKELYYKYGILVKARQAADANSKKSRLAYIEDNEWIYLFRTIAAICNQSSMSVKKLFEDAKIDISDLKISNKAGAAV